VLTPTEIHSKKFKRSILGFDIDEVNDFSDHIIRDYDLLIQENRRLKQQHDSSHLSGVRANYCPKCGYHLSGDRD